jgi:hypothetical protein
MSGKHTLGRVFRDEVLELVDRNMYPAAPPGAANVVAIKWFWIKDRSADVRDGITIVEGPHGPFDSEEEATSDALEQCDSVRTDDQKFEWEE